MAAFRQCELRATEAFGSEAFNRKELLGWRVGIGSPIAKWAPPTAAPRHVLTVLVVDDDEDTADGLVRLVRRWGHAASLAYNGGNALQVAFEQRPNVVLLDVQMPHMDGRELAQQLRLNLGAAECLIIAITGDTDEPGRHQCHEAGIDLVLIKPVDPTVIETLLQLETERVNHLFGPARTCLEVKRLGMVYPQPLLAPPVSRH
ncbi:MAG TPA: response regulator [Planctomycetaceae bacterium]|nr:response regulator [Planctomycetaceae bacterium]